MQVERQLLGDIATVYVGLTTKLKDVKDQSPSGNLLTVRALEDMDIDRDELVNFDFGKRDVSKYQAKPGDLLLSARSTTPKMAIVPKDLDGIVINATVVGIRLEPTLLSPSLDSRLLAAYFTDGRAALESLQSGSAIVNITAKALQQLEVPVPPLEFQQQMVELLTAADNAYSSAVEAAHLRRRLARRVTIDQMLASK